MNAAEEHTAIRVTKRASVKGEVLVWVWSMLLDEYGWKDFSCQEALDDWLRRNPH